MFGIYLNWCCFIKSCWLLCKKIWEMISCSTKDYCTVYSKRFSLSICYILHDSGSKPYNRHVQPVTQDLKACGPRKGLDFKYSVVHRSKT